MAILLILICIWALSIICLGLLYSLYQNYERISTEREDNQQMLLQILNDAKLERRELYDRLTAGTLSDFKTHEDTKNEVIEDEDEDVVPLDEAKEELMNG